MTAIRNNTSLSPNNSPEKEREFSEQLKQWAQDHSKILEVLLDAYCIVDLSNRLVEFNVAFTELCGESYRKIQKIGDFCQLIKTEFCPHQCPAKQVITSGKPLRIDELKGASKVHPELQLIVAGVPVTNAKGEIIGSLITIRNVSAENELQKKYGERARESITDGLTRLYNKVFSEAALLRSLKSSLREGLPVSVAMTDIDHFKRVNDTYGHQAGDYVLSIIANLLKNAARDSDVVGRFGGEEFIVILENCDVTGAKIFAERFRKKVEATKIVFEGKTIHATVSVGTSTFLETWKPGVNAEMESKELVNQADNALYNAKASGRNRLAQFETLPSNKKKGGSQD